MSCLSGKCFLILLFPSRRKEPGIIMNFSEESELFWVKQFFPVNFYFVRKAFLQGNILMRNYWVTLFSIWGRQGRNYPKFELCPYNWTVSSILRQLRRERISTTAMILTPYTWAWVPHVYCCSHRLHRKSTERDICYHRDVFCYLARDAEAPEAHIQSLLPALHLHWSKCSNFRLISHLQNNV